jgi:hypothetical protein
VGAWFESQDELHVFVSLSSFVLPIVSQVDTMGMGLKTFLGVLAILPWAWAANPRPYPTVDSYLQTTNFLNHSSYINNLDDHQWYLDNIPFIDVPDQNIQDVYYYRASVVKRHIKWAHEG